MRQPGYIYLMRLHTSDNIYECPYKIGQSLRPTIRRSQLGIVMPYELSIVRWIPTEDMDYAEAWLHAEFEGFRLRGEWFKLGEQELISLLRWPPMANLGQYDFWFPDGSRFVRSDHPEWEQLYAEYIRVVHEAFEGNGDIPF